MLNRFKSLLTAKSPLAALYSSSVTGYLARSGWRRSFLSKRAVDQDGRSLPWFTYPSIAFLEPRISPEMTVFEFGSGSSTLWWASRVKRVVAVEHDPLWLAQVRDKAPPNVELIHRPLDTYADSIRAYEGVFDIVVIDGRDRNRCAENAPPALNAQGVVIWDNSERPEYGPGFECLTSRHFRRLDFVGMGPIAPFAWTTSVFYRSENCLSI